MRRRSITGQQSHFEGINATPLIDVVMCLIIFFLIVGKLATDRGAAVKLPESAAGAEERSRNVLVVTVARLPGAGVTANASPSRAAATWADLGVRVQLDGDDQRDSKSLEGAVRIRMAGSPELSVQVRADRDLPFGLIEPVLRACGNAGAKGVRFAAERTG
jgi:biopolymer transport protein ExbD